MEIDGYFYEDDPHAQPPLYTDKDVMDGMRDALAVEECRRKAAERREAELLAQIDDCEALIRLLCKRLANQMDD